MLIKNVSSIIYNTNITPSDSSQSPKIQDRVAASPLKGEIYRFLNSPARIFAILQFQKSMQI